MKKNEDEKVNPDQKDVMGVDPQMDGIVGHSNRVMVGSHPAGHYGGHIGSRSFHDIGKLHGLYLLMEDLAAGKSVPAQMGMKPSEYEDMIRENWRDLSSFEKLLASCTELPIELSGNTIIVRPFNDEPFLKTKLLIPQGAKEKSMMDIYKEHPMQGIVLNAGPGFMMESGKVRPVNYIFGDHVLIDHSRQGMLSDFILNGKLYYKVIDSLVIGRMLGGYSRELEGLSFIKKS